eukprot:g18626.t1
MGAAVAQLAFPVPPKHRFAEALRKRPDLLYLETESEETTKSLQFISVAVFVAQTASFCTPTGTQRSRSRDSARLPRHELLKSYDYCGYGFSEGTPTEETCNESIEAAYAYLRQQFAPNRIILFGRSIGTGLHLNPHVTTSNQFCMKGPTVELALRHPEIRGMVLQSPIESCGRVVFGTAASWLGYRMDLFRNYEKMDQVRCPVLVMHGTDDDIVPIENGFSIHEACQNAVEPLWLEGYGHNDLPNEFMDEMDGLSWGWNIFVTNLATHISVNL